MEIGQKIKQLRIKNGLTLEELASRSELTKGFLSQVERNLTSPSIATLNDILEALGTSLASFFKEDVEEKCVFTKDDFFTDEKDGYIVHWIVPNAQKNEMEPILVEIEPDSQSQVLDPHDGEEFGYVLSGRIKLVDGDKQSIVKKGETFYIKGQNSHYLKNESQTVAKVLWITTPPLF
ncbi:MAG: helix-turn-helix domain-containing protein [Traorella sp.]